MFNVSRGLSPKIVNELFQFRKQISYVLRQRFQIQISSVYSVFSGTESLKFLGPKIWTLVPNEISLGKFWNAIKQRKPTTFSCRPCKRYIHRIVSFFNKILWRNAHDFFSWIICLFYFISFYEVTCQLLCKYLVDR